MDLLVRGEERHRAADLAPLVDIDAEGVATAYARSQRVRDATAYLHADAISIEPSDRPAADVCGIAGILHADQARADRRDRRCAGWRGRSATAGPTGTASRSGRSAGFVSTRLAIFDIQYGWQPMQGAHRDTVIVYNGEVFNHPELRRELEARDELNRTTSDTEVVLRLLDRDGPHALDTLNGQWAIAQLGPAPRARSR